MTIVHDMLTSLTAELTRVVDAPTDGIVYGSDITGALDLDSDMAERPERDPLLITEALARRLDTPRGSLPDDLDYGLDLKGHCNRGITSAEVNSLAGRIRGEVTKDDRVGDATVRVVPGSNGESLSITVNISPTDPSLAPFRFTLAVTDATVFVETLTA